MAGIFNTFTEGGIWSPTDDENRFLCEKSGLLNHPLYLNPKMFSLPKEHQIYALLIFLIKNKGGGQYTFLKYLKTGILPRVRQSHINLCVYQYCENNFSIPEKLFFADVFDQYLRKIEYAFIHEPLNIQNIKDSIVAYYQKIIVN